MKKVLVLITSILLAAYIFGAGFTIKPLFYTYGEGSDKKLVYSITPVLDLDVFKVGIGLNAYQKDIGGTFYYGSPTSESTDFINGLSLNFLEVDFDPFGARYGYMGKYTFGLGTMMYGYTNKLERAFDVRIGSKKSINLRGHIPFEINTWTPNFELKQSSSLYFSTINYGALSLFAAKNMGENLTHNDTVLGGGAYINILGMNLGGEGGIITTSSPSTETFGYMAGIGGSLDLGIIRFRALPILYMSKSTLLGYIDKDYENGNNYTKLLNQNKTRFGGIYELNIKYTNILTANARYNYDINGMLESFSNQRIYAWLNVKSPFEGYPFLLTGYYNRNMNDNEWLNNVIEKPFDAKTDMEYSISYEMADGLYISYVTFYDNTEDNFKNRVDITTSVEF
ncbi:hypothetical protein OSSY52_07960 [Tepiditoga spiralis]|uniref:Uncharacterized protein n=1 Tax=Tepiditoga spiralis TaxID=2108365 RepID=A0A7G1G3P4_9BACT|nr:hypothetical protein [Tepiditoga spiralis]BBE30655.1 hypothetical protein OSSY52_07960 [Tepiditoga spiralis]